MDFKWKYNVFNLQKVLISYKEFKRGKANKDIQVYSHVVHPNQSRGPYRDYFCPVWLIDRQIKYATETCYSDDNPLLFPFKVICGKSFIDPAQDQNLNKWLPIPPHATRDVCVWLGVACGLSDLQLKSLLLHSEKSNVMASNYSNLRNQWGLVKDDPEMKKLLDSLEIVPVEHASYKQSRTLEDIMYKSPNMKCAKPVRKYPFAVLALLNNPILKKRIEDIGRLIDPSSHPDELPLWKVTLDEKLFYHACTMTADNFKDRQDFITFLEELKYLIVITE
jgi:hypothetical protein